jgi:hypothetical protein
LPDSLVIAKARKPALQHHFADMEQQRDASSLGSRASGFLAECFASFHLRFMHKVPVQARFSNKTLNNPTPMINAVLAIPSRRRPPWLHHLAANTVPRLRASRPTRQSIFAETPVVGRGGVVAWRSVRTLSC